MLSHYTTKTSQATSSPDLRWRDASGQFELAEGKETTEAWPVLASDIDKHDVVTHIYTGDTIISIYAHYHPRISRMIDSITMSKTCAIKPQLHVLPTLEHHIHSILPSAGIDTRLLSPMWCRMQSWTCVHVDPADFLVRMDGRL